MCGIHVKNKGQIFFYVLQLLVVIDSFISFFGYW